MLTSSLLSYWLIFRIHKLSANRRVYESRFVLAMHSKLYYWQAPLERNGCIWPSFNLLYSLLQEARTIKITTTCTYYVTLKPSITALNLCSIMNPSETSWQIWRLLRSDVRMILYSDWFKCLPYGRMDLYAELKIVTTCEAVRELYPYHYQCKICTWLTVWPTNWTPVCWVRFPN